jgi:hypothetical protein
MTYEEARRLAECIQRNYPIYSATARLYVHPLANRRVVDVKNTRTGRMFSVRSWHEWQMELEREPQPLKIREVVG